MFEVGEKICREAIAIFVFLMAADGVYKPTPEEQFMQQKSLLIKLEKQKDEVGWNTILLVFIFFLITYQQQ